MCASDVCSYHLPVVCWSALLRSNVCGMLSAGFSLRCATALWFVNWLYELDAYYMICISWTWFWATCVVALFRFHCLTVVELQLRNRRLTLLDWIVIYLFEVTGITLFGCAAGYHHEEGASAKSVARHHFWVWVVLPAASCRGTRGHLQPPVTWGEQEQHTAWLEEEDPRSMSFPESKSIGAPFLTISAP